MVMGFELVHVGLGDTVVIQGAGGLGLYATALAKDRGAAKVIVIDALTQRLEMATRMGADHVVDFASAPTPGERAQQ